MIKFYPEDQIEESGYLGIKLPMNGVERGFFNMSKTTEEHRNKLSTSKKEYYENNEHWNSGKSWSDEVKKKISDSNLGKEMSESNKEQLSNRMKGNGYAKTRKCSIDGIEFNSMAAASRYHNKPVDWISVRLKSNKLEFQNWYFL